MSTQPEKKLHSALTDANLGEAVRSDFLRAWQNAELLLEAFSQGTKLPIIAFLRDALIFESSIAVLLKFGTPIDSEWKAHLSEFVDRKPGMRTAHREIDTPAGLLTILMGEPSLPHENGSLKAGPEIAPMAHSQLSATPEEFSSKEDHREMNKADPALVDSVAELLRHLVFAPVFFRESIISMAHEVGLSLLSMGLLSKEIDELASQISGRADPLNLAHKHLMNLACKHLRAETQLGGGCASQCFIS